MKYKTFQQKLDRFKREPIGFLVKSKEIADELAKVLEGEGLEKNKGDIRECLEEALDEAKFFSGDAYIVYNASQGNTVTHGTSDFEGEEDKSRELLDITLEELKSYNAPQTLEDKLALFKAGTHVLHTPTQEIYDKLMVELEKRGYVWQNGDNTTKNPLEWIDLRDDTCILAKPKGICKAPMNFYEDYTGLGILEFTPEDFSTPQVITITSDGYHRVTAESNGVTTEALCNPTDTFDISKGSHMALKRLLEKLDDDTIEELGDLSGSTLEEPEGLCNGDIVEVVECDFSFADDINGIQGVIITGNNGVYGVRFPVKYNGDYTWTFYGSELKLVRKYNA